METSRKFRLLIVDDDQAVHDEVWRILSIRPEDSLSAGQAALPSGQAAADVHFVIESVYQQEQALTVLRQAKAADQPFALAFVNLEGPSGANGVETLRGFWQVDADLQAVLTTARSGYDWREVARQLGFSHNFVIVNKPFDRLEVLQLAASLALKWSYMRDAQQRLQDLNRLLEQQTDTLAATARELEAAKQAAKAAALQDSLTKLPNRQLFQNRLSLALQRTERHPGYVCALLYLDLDDFKIINEGLGHQAGDELLMEAAGRLESCLRRTDSISRFPGGEDLVVRLGGDEFAILLEELKDASDALRVADRIAEKFRKPFQVRGKELSVSVSIGITTSSTGYTSAEEMLRDADTAMYRAKAAGRGRRVVFDEAMHRRAVERLQLESELRQALERNEFILYYQPIVSLPGKKIMGFEALLRWRSPERGLVVPDVFIPIAEETGLIVPMGAWVLREACKQLRRWQQRFGTQPPLYMSVNISGRQFLQPDLVSVVEQAVKEAGIDGCSLCLELTESTAMEEPEHTYRTLEELQRLGVRLSIDDFGTGYSSLDQLHRFSVDTLKVDRYFIARMAADERNQKIVNTIIDLAHNLRMNVVAEGAETSEHVDLLDGMACDCVQGFVFSRPLEPEKFESFLEKRSFEVDPEPVRRQDSQRWAAAP